MGSHRVRHDRNDLAAVAVAADFWIAAIQTGVKWYFIVVLMHFREGILKTIIFFK